MSVKSGKFVIRDGYQLRSLGADCCHKCKQPLKIGDMCYRKYFVNNGGKFRTEIYHNSCWESKLY